MDRARTQPPVPVRVPRTARLLFRDQLCEAPPPAMFRMVTGGPIREQHLAAGQKQNNAAHAVIKAFEQTWVQTANNEEQHNTHTTRQHQSAANTLTHNVVGNPDTKRAMLMKIIIFKKDNVSFALFPSCPSTAQTKNGYIFRFFFFTVKHVVNTQSVTYSAKNTTCILFIVPLYHPGI